MADFKNMVAEMDALLAEAARPLGVWAPGPKALSAGPLVFQFEDALAAVTLTGDATIDRAALEAAADAFGRTLDIAHRVWWQPAIDAVERALVVNTAARRAA